MNNIKEFTPLEEDSRQYNISNIGNVLHNMSCSMDDEDEQNEFGGYASYLWDLADDFRDIAKPVTLSPIYTQEMTDNDELPLVGMEVGFHSTFFTHKPSNTGTCTILHIALNKVWIDVHGSIDHVLSLDVISFKPITPPIELIDGEPYQFEHKGQTRYAPYIKDINFFSDADMHINPDSCTNIKLLKVK